MQYRKVLYENYHTTQSGRASNTDAQSLFNREKRQFSHEILPALSKMDKTAKIYDMGCGSGSLLKALQENGFSNTTGMDLSMEQVQMAAHMGVANVIHGDALAHLKSGKQTYDVILGMDIIEHFTKDELVELLQTIKAQLSPGGLAIFRTPNLDAPIATAFANGDFTHENYMNASSAQQVFMACGFKTVVVRESFLSTYQPFKEIFRKILWMGLKFKLKLWLFATARSTQNILFTPNMIIQATN